MKLANRKSKRVPTARRRVQSQNQAPAAFSYHSQRSERQEVAGRQLPQNSEQHKPRGFVDFWIKRTGFLVGSIIILICAISIVSLSSSPRMIVLSSGSSNVSSQQLSGYQQAASRDLSGSIWNRNKVTVNTAGVADTLKRQFPELSDVSITLPLLGHRPIIYIQTAQPAFIYNAVNGSYVLDASGKALATNQTNLAKLNLPVLTDQTNQHVTIGQPVLTTSNTTFIRTVIAELAAKQIPIGALILPAGAADELDVHLSGLTYYVKFNMYQGSDARQQAGTFIAVQARLKAQNITPTQYIDVRVDGRAYYQ